MLICVIQFNDFTRTTIQDFYTIRFLLDKNQVVIVNDRGEVLELSLSVFRSLEISYYSEGKL